MRKGLLITGGNGKLGFEIARLAGENYDVVSLGRREADVTRFDHLFRALEAARPQIIVNCAGWTDVDGAESHPDEARAVNALGPANVAKAASRLGARLIHVSTDFVFDGTKSGPYTEKDAPNPLSVYGRTKLEGERAVMELARDACIVRSAWLYGVRGRDFLTAILERARAGSALRVIDDQFGSPTWAADLAQAILALVPMACRGLVHFVNAGKASRYDEACEALRLVGIQTKVERVTASEYKLAARRPYPQSVLDTGLYGRLTGKQPRSWREAMAEFLTAPKT